MSFEPFDRLVVLIRPDDRNKPVGNGRAIYEYDPKREAAIPYSQVLSARLLSFLGSGKSYYLVTRTAEVACRPINVVINDARGRKRLIEFSATVRGIKRDGVGDAVAALAAGPSPFETFDAALRASFREHVEVKRAARVDVASKLADDPGSRQAYATQLSRQLSEKFRLEVECEIRLPEEELRVENLVIEAKVLVRDCEEQVRLKMELSVHPPESDEERDLAIRCLTPDLPQSLERRAVRWFRESCSLEQFCYEQNWVRNALEEQIRSYIEGELHRVLVHFRIDCTVPFQTTFRVREDYKVTCRVEPGQTEVPVHHKVLVERTDIAKFRAERVADLEKWLEELLSQRTRSALFSQTYANVLLDFDGIGNTIKLDVQHAVEKIGFRVEQLITIPTDEDMRSLLDRKLTINTDVLKVLSKDARVDFRLSIHGIVELPELHTIKADLRPGDYLRGQVIRRITEATEQEIRKITPECLHTHFSDDLAAGHASATEDEPVTACSSPSQQIQAAILQTLQDRFSAKAESLTLTPHPTELTEIYAALCPPDSHRIAIGVHSRGSAGEPLQFTVGYRVQGIASGHWADFERTARGCRAEGALQKGLEIVTAIGKTVTTAIREVAEGLPPRVLISVHPQERRQLKSILCAEAVGRAEREFGLLLEITDFITGVTQATTREQSLRDTRIADSMSRLADLRAARLAKQSEYEADDPVMVALNGQIDDLERNLAKDLTTGHDDMFEEVTGFAGPSRTMLTTENVASPALPSPPIENEG